MTAETVIAVVGATGAQGGGLARAILDDPDGRYSCRAVTRNPGSVAARALADRGAVIVQADLDDQNSLVEAFQGASSAFCMTNFFQRFSPEKELEQAANLAAAAKAAGIGHVIWSTSPDSSAWARRHGDRLPVLRGGYRVPHWDGKARADRFFTDSGVATTFLRPSMFWENFLAPGTPQFPQRGPDGVLAITLPAGAAKLPGMAAEDIGRCAYAIVKAGAEFHGRWVGLAGEHLTAAELAAGLSQALGETVRYNDIPLAALRAAPIPGADAIGNMFQIITDDNEEYCAHYDIGLSRALNPGLQTFAEWVVAARDHSPIAAGTAYEGSR
ncbi:MAG: NmrA/HSCARG family protein [Actinomycetota bacterium]|nr:NmrA/HSCARG family protein [Actinomycetota bacterium]